MFVSVVFGIVFFITELPLYLALIFGGIALATAPAPALSIVNEYHTSGPVTKTLIPLAAIDDIIGVVVFFTVISIVNGIDGNASDSLFAVVGMILLPFVIGILVGVLASFLIKRSRNNVQSLLLLVASLCTSAVCGLLVDNYVFHAFCTIAVALHNGTTVPDKKGEDRFFRAIEQNHAEQKASKAA